MRGRLRPGGCHGRAMRFEVAVAGDARPLDANRPIGAMAGSLHLLVPEAALRFRPGGVVRAAKTASGGG